MNNETVRIVTGLTLVIAGVGCTIFENRQNRAANALAEQIKADQQIRTEQVNNMFQAYKLNAEAARKAQAYVETLIENGDIPHTRDAIKEAWDTQYAFEMIAIRINQ